MTGLAARVGFSELTVPSESLEHDPHLRLSARRAEILAYYARHLDQQRQLEPAETRPAQERQPRLDFELPDYAPVQARAESFHALQEWEGSVLSVKDGRFLAALIDITADERVANETVELSVDDVQEEDLSRLKPGAIFRWVIGYARTPAGTKTRGSRMYFRREPPRRGGGRREDDLLFEP